MKRSADRKTKLQREVLSEMFGGLYNVPKKDRERLGVSEEMVNAEKERMATAAAKGIECLIPPPFKKKEGKSANRARSSITNSCISPTKAMMTEPPIRAFDVVKEMRKVVEDAERSGKGQVDVSMLKMVLHSPPRNKHGRATTTASTTAITSAAGRNAVDMLGQRRGSSATSTADQAVFSRRMSATATISSADKVAVPSSRPMTTPAVSGTGAGMVAKVRRRPSTAGNNNSSTTSSTTSKPRRPSARKVKHSKEPNTTHNAVDAKSPATKGQQDQHHHLINNDTELEQPSMLSSAATAIEAIAPEGTDAATTEAIFRKLLL